MKIYSVDPGGHVGYAVWDDIVSVEQREDTFVPNENFASGEMTPYHLFNCIEDLVDVSDVVVCEAFIIAGSRTKSSNETIEQIGVLRYLCSKTGTTFVEQPPGVGKMFAGKSWINLKTIGWYRKGPDHANSAAGHLAYYLSTNGLIDPARLLTPTPTGS